MLAWLKMHWSERLRERGETLRRGGEPRRARAAYQRALHRVQPMASRTPSAREVASKARIGLGRVALMLDEPRLAVEELEAAAKSCPGAWETHYWRGCALAWSGSYEAADNALTTALELAPEQNRIRVQRAYVRIKNGRERGALADLEAVDPATLGGRGRLVMAALFLKRGQWKRAEDLLRPLVTDAQSPSEAALMLGQSLEGQKQWRQAAAIYRQAANSPRIAARARIYLGRTLQQTDEDPEALRCLERAIAGNKVEDSALFHHGWLCYRLRRLERCISSWERLHRRHPRQQYLTLALARARHARGCELVHEGRLEAALPFWEMHCRDRQPETDIEAFLALAEICFRAAAQRLSSQAADDRTIAQGHLSRGRELAPEDARFPRYLALLEALAGHFEEAHALLRDAASLAPSDPHPELFAALCSALKGDATTARAEGDRWRRLVDEKQYPARLERALAALHIQRRQWARGAALLKPTCTADEPTMGLLAMCLFRSGNHAALRALDGGGPAVAFWQAGSWFHHGDRRRALERLLAASETHTYEPVKRAAGRLLFLRSLTRAARHEWRAAGNALVEARSVAGGRVGPVVVEALSLLMAARRREALAVLEEALRAEPSDGKIAHLLGLVSYHTASAAAPQSVAGWIEVWRPVIASWVVLEFHQGFWEQWESDTQKRYGYDGSLANLCAALRSRLPDLLTAAFEANPAARQLEWLLGREHKATEALVAAGGLPTPGTEHERWHCGPLGLGMLGCPRRFGAFLAALPEWRPGSRGMLGLFGVLGRRRAPRDETGLKPDAKLRLRRYFSNLGAAQGLLDIGRPRDALTSLEILACPRCGKTRARDPEWAGIAGVCVETCADFDALNPGYVGLENKARSLLEDALDLAIEAWLGVSQVSITAREVDLMGAAEAWRQALRLAKRNGKTLKVERRVAELVLGRIACLRRTKRRDEAIELVQAAQSVATGKLEDQWSGQLANLYADRGVDAGNDHRWPAAVDDLRLAVRLNPHSHRALLNLSIALEGGAMDCHQRAPETAIDFLEEALRMLRAGAPRLQGRPDLQRQLRSAVVGFSSMVTGKAFELSEAEKYEEALALLQRGLRELPGHPLLMATYRGALQAQVLALFQLGRAEEAVERLSQCGEMLRGRTSRVAGDTDRETE